MNDTLYPAMLIMGRWNPIDKTPVVIPDGRTVKDENDAQDRLSRYMSLEYAGGLHYEYQIVPVPCVDKAMEMARRNLIEAQRQEAGCIPFCGGDCQRCELDCAKHMRADDLMDCPTPPENDRLDAAQRWTEQRGG